MPKNTTIHPDPYTPRQESSNGEIRKEKGGHQSLLSMQRLVSLHNLFENLRNQNPIALQTEAEHKHQVEVCAMKTGLQ